VEPVTVVKVGYEQTVDGVQLRVLYPLGNYEGEEPDHQHHATVVVRATYGATSVLLTGDLEGEHEAELLAHDSAVLRSDVLKVTHHGSGSATSDAFLDAVDPDSGLISAGAGNQFGHPHQATLDRLAAHDVKVLRTDRDGTIECRSNGVAIGCEGDR
jgi:competence protein ComEC